MSKGGRECEIVTAKEMRALKFWGPSTPSLVTSKPKSQKGGADAFFIRLFARQLLGPWIIPHLPRGQQLVAISLYQKRQKGRKLTGNLIPELIANTEQPK